MTSEAPATSPAPATSEEAVSKEATASETAKVVTNKVATKASKVAFNVFDNFKQVKARQALRNARPKYAVQDKATLPNTGDHSTALVVAIGASILATSFVGLHRKRYNQ